MAITDKPMSPMKRKKWEYPLLVKGRSSDIVVLATGMTLHDRCVFHGVVLQQGKGDRLVGVYYTDWWAGSFEPLTEPITLTLRNEEPNE